MEKSELRHAFIVALKKYNNPNNIIALVHDLALICYEENLITGEEIRRNFNYEEFKRGREPGSEFIKNYWSDISSLYWEFLTDGTIAFGEGPYPSSFDLSCFHVTDYGKEWLESEVKPIPKDAEGYLKFLRASIPDLDDVIIQYISEALNTFSRGFYFASAVMLGAASEKVIYILANQINKSMNSQNLDKKFSEALEYRKLNQLLTKVYEILRKNIKKIPFEVHEDSIESLQSLFNAIRIQRNDAVHPVAGKVSKEQLRLLLSSFPHVCKKAYDILGWLRASNRET